MTKVDAIVQSKTCKNIYVHPFLFPAAEMMHQKHGREKGEVRIGEVWRSAFGSKERIKEWSCG